MGVRDHAAAYKLLEDMRGRQMVLTPYLEQEVIDEIHDRVGAGPAPERAGGGRQQGAAAGRGAGLRGGDDDEDDEELGEELEEVVDEIISDDEMGGK